MNYSISTLYYCSKTQITSSKQLYKYLLQQCKKLPNGPKQHYIFSIKQSFKQHINETDPERIRQMVDKSLTDSEWILKKEKSKMFRVPLATGEFPVTEEGFWNSVFLYHTSPHLVNRRLLSVLQLFFIKINFNHDVYRVKDILKYSELYSQIYKIEKIDSEFINESVLTNILSQYGDQFNYKIVDLNEVQNSVDGVFVSIRILLPRIARANKNIEFVILDKENNLVTFSCISISNEQSLGPSFPYDVELDPASLMKIYVNDIEIAEHKSSEWLADVLFPKLIQWCEKRDSNFPVQKSLSLISVEKYYSLYQELKLKYGEDMIKIWPENTDPLKFVYEDVAIATYLLLLWQNKQKFVDLGCGNGLLVHILNQEGHIGFGIDVRPRKIWKMYPNTTHLKIQTIIPSSSNLFPEADWIIGNHSDELTPWIPVIAARSSRNCKFFLLPCCAYEFNGKKFQRNNSAQSQYQEYLDYVKFISETCGFITEIDRLRIPSTKRICLVGTRPNNHVDFQTIDENITKLINEKCGSDCNNRNGEWVENYAARTAVEVVRNCTKLNKDLLESIVDKVTSHLLSEKNYLTSSSGKQWNAGKIEFLPNLVKLIPTDELKQLKKECGGLQTLLKNHHFIFLVKNGNVQLRMPVVNAKNYKNKSRNCWFFKNHPDGCTLDAETCSYLH